MGLISIDHTKPVQLKPTDSFGCPFDKLYKDQSVVGADIAFFRKGSRDGHLQQVEAPASDRGFVVGVSTSGGHSRRVFHEHHATNHAFDRDAIYIRDLSDHYKADLGGAFDFLLLQISPASLERIAAEAELAGVNSLAAEMASKDVVLSNLARVLIPALESPEEAPQLFVDQMATAIGSYLVQRYGKRSAPNTPRSRKLSRVQETRAKSLLLDNLDGEISVLDVARACNLSRGYFIQAFRQTTGMTPYQWLLNERVSRARELLRTPDISLSEVAISCGFADQSHFTRVFTSLLGTTPGNWRRSC
ncbi:helix-turn-helix transcriptional regulator [Rhizobium cauense]|uniref:AraC family transcriptional regulator n=1 Tax=Rhizobium cauense TaxID=1166683 RepID=UPI001C6F456A|nr:AraC family transcriptional regulator [Rhizobium cauense]MBW9116570.1 helix-turn-helix transcriptional regulator [Rhizobium cauense]